MWGADFGHKQTAGRTEHLDSNLCAGRGPHPPLSVSSCFVYYYFYYYYEVSFLLSEKKPTNFLY